MITTRYVFVRIQTSLTVVRYGYTTWEWSEGLRSYFYPGLFALVYKALSFIGYDTVLMVVSSCNFLQLYFKYD
jgi:hypothetical protein